MRFVTYKELNDDVIRNIHQIPNDIDVVVGIPRSGLMLATIIALYLNKPVVDINSFAKGQIYAVGATKNTERIVSDFSNIKKVLIVEDSSYSGNSIIKAKQIIRQCGYDFCYIYLAAYVQTNTKNLVDLYFQIIDDDRVFEWNYLHNSALSTACMDLDGVLCVDPTDEENDDGEKYITFIKNARVKLCPTRKVGYIVTSRLEKYRALTEEWLHENNIEYGKLYMMNIATASERQQLGNHGSYKANIYKRIKQSNWFIESNIYQAEEINEITGKPVFCIDNQCFYPSGMRVRFANTVNQGLYKKIRFQLEQHLPKKVFNQLIRIKRALFP